MTHGDLRGCPGDRAALDGDSRWPDPIQAFVDGEFGEAERAELERHVAGCASCARRARAQAAFKSALKAGAPHTAMPAASHQRVIAALARERPVGWQPRWRVVLRHVAPPVAAAVLVAALIGPSHRFSPVAAEAISAHRRDLPMEIAGNAEQVSNWFRPKVDFAVRPPILPSARLVGARLAQIRDRQAAYLVYDVSGNRVSVFLFDPSDVPIDARHRRHAAGKDIYLDERAGYHVALLRSGGVGYAFTSDLDEDHIFQLVSSTVAR